MTNRALLSVVAFDMTSADGNIVVDPGALVTVYEEDGTTLLAQSMYATNVSVIPLANPLIANNLGVATAYAVTPQNCVVKVGGVSYPAQFFQNMGDVLTVPTPLPLTQKTPATVAAPGAGLDSIYPLTTGVYAHRANGGAEKIFVETTTSQTLTNKTLTSPTINGGTLSAATLTGDVVSDTLSLPNGSVGAPSLFHTGDSDTGQWFPANDQIAWSAGGVEAGRFRVNSLDGTKPGWFEAKVRDKGGFVANLEAFAGGVTINNYQADGTGGDADSAWIAALAYLTSVGGGILEVGVGTFAAPSAAVTWTNNIQIRGTYGKTTILHRPNSSQTPIIALSMTRFGLLNLIIDGNLANNLTYGYPGAEVAITGTDISVIGCTIKDFNIFGIQVAGTRVRVNDNTIYVNNGDGWPSPYPTLTVFTQSGYRGYVGIATPGGIGVCTDIEVSRNMISGLRGPGIFVGGAGVKIDGNIVRNCHRTYCLTPSNATTGGGVVATSQTDDGLGGLRNCSDFVISNNITEPPPAADVVTFGSWNNGIELNSSNDGVVSGNAVRASQYGISFDTTTDIKVVGGTVSGPLVAGLLAVGDTSDWSVSDVNFHGNGTAVWIAGAVDNYSIQHCHFKGNTVNWNNTATGKNFDVTGNVTVDGDLVPESRSMAKTVAYAGQYLNDTTTGYGLLIQAGTTGSEFALNVQNRRGGAELFYVVGNGQLFSVANQAVVFGATLTNTSATGYGLKVTAGTDDNQFLLALRSSANAPVLDVFAGGAVNMGGLANGQIMGWRTQTELLALSTGTSTFDTVMTMPAGAVVLGVDVRVTVTTTTTATFTVGDSGSTARFSTAAVSIAAGSTDPGTKAGAYYNAAATAVRITTNANPGNNNGRIRVTMHYYQITPATS